MSTAIAYHQATKYHPETISQLGGPDWSKQPLPYKSYDTAEPIALAGYLPMDPNPFTGKPASAAAHADLTTAGPTLASLSRLLFFTYGITAIIENQPQPMYLRACPSAGGLYPAELYIVSRGMPGLPGGLYGYDPRQHQLVPLWEDAQIAADLAAACYQDAAILAAPVSVVVSGVFARSSWRYGERAYRRILLDTGHLIGNAGLVAHALSLRLHVSAAFCDQRLDTLLRLESEEEGSLAVLALNAPGPVERPSWCALGSGHGSATPEPPLLNALHRSSALPSERPAMVARGEDQADDLESRYGAHSGIILDAPNTDGALAQDILSAILHRRSTRRYRRAAITRLQLARILSSGSCPERMGLGLAHGLDPGLIMTFVAVLAVDGLASGLYYFAPHRQELRLLTPTCRRDAVQFICLGQELGGDAAVVIFHATDLARAVRRQGDRVYRYLHLDAGMIGQRLNLAALAEGLGASGIGGFFDDQVTALLGIPSEQAVLYVTTIGTPAGPVET